MLCRRGHAAVKCSGLCAARPACHHFATPSIVVARHHRNVHTGKASCAATASVLRATSVSSASLTSRPGRGSGRSRSSSSMSARSMDAVLSGIEDTSIRSAIASDHARIVCYACGMQYDESDAAQLAAHPNHCPICDDPRQAIPESGQAWTSAGQWLQKNEMKCALSQEPNDPRLLRITVDSGSDRSVGIGQTPIVIVTEHGVLIWDCCAVFTPELFTSIKALSHQYNAPLLGIAISHPHFYTTALTWAKALDTQVYVSHFDRQWWMRNADADALQRHVVFFDTQQHSLAPGLTIVRCGGHFDGSTVLHWDRAVAKAPSSFVADKPLPNTGVILCADTFAPNADRETFTFMWSYPNWLPLPPSAVAQIWQAVRPYEFDDVIGGWPGRVVRGKARGKMLHSAKRFITMEGHDVDKFDL